MWKKLLIFISMTWMISSANSAQITCQFSGNACNVNSATAVTQPNEVITLSGVPSNYVNNAIQSIGLNGLNFAYFPTGIFKIFPNTATVSMNGGYSTNLLQNAFSNCLNLLTIYMTNGNIPTIPQGFAQTCSKLNTVIFWQSNVARVDKNAFIGLKNLENLILNQNKITCLPYDLFQNTPSLKQINLSNNKITVIDSNLFKNLPNLYKVDFSFNMIASLPYFDLSTTGTNPLIFTIECHFENNPIRSINPKICSMFTSRSKMDSIYITNNLCVTNNANNINKQSCPYFASLLQSCYSNWRPTTYVPIQC